MSRLVLAWLPSWHSHCSVTLALTLARRSLKVPSHACTVVVNLICKLFAVPVESEAEADDENEDEDEDEDDPIGVGRRH